MAYKVARYIFISFFGLFLMSQNVFADTPVTEGYIFVDYKLCGQYYSTNADNVISDCSAVKVLEGHTGSQAYPGITYNSADQKFYIEFDDILSNDDISFCSRYGNGCHLIVSQIYFQPFDSTNSNSNNRLTAEGVLNVEIYSPYQWFYGPMINFSTSDVTMELQGYFINPASYDFGYSYNSPYPDSWDYLCYDQNETECWLGVKSSSTDWRYNAELHLDMSIDGGSSSLFNSFIFFARPWNSLTNQYVNTPSIIIDIPYVDSQMDFTFEMKVWLSDTMPSGSDSGDLDINQETSDFYQNEYNSVDNISGQSTSDINAGDMTAMNNLIGNISSFFNQINNVSPNTACTVPANFGHLNLGDISLCTGKENLPWVVTFGAYAFQMIWVVGIALLIIRQVLGVLDWSRN